jgi:hypothetical protein
MERSKSVDPAPRSDSRPWGSFHVLDEGPTYKVKRIEVLPGKRLSYQKHAQRSEHWTPISTERNILTFCYGITPVLPGNSENLPLKR